MGRPFNLKFNFEKIRQNNAHRGQYLNIFARGFLPAHVGVILHLLLAKKSPLLVWRDLVDAVAHTYRRFLVSWASQMGLPTVWKGEGRVTYGRLYMTWVPLKYSSTLGTVFCTGC